MKKNFKSGKLKKILIISFSIPFACIVLHYLIFMYPALKDNYENSDLIVVFGNKVETSGLPSERLKRRLDKAVKLYNEGTAKKIVVSGALGIEGFNEPDVMKKYLVGCKVAADDVITDSAGFDTFSTVRNVRAMPFVKNDSRIIAVTDYYHIPRAKMAFQKAGFKNVGAARANIAPETTDIKSIIREFAAYYYYLFRNYE